MNRTTSGVSLSLATTERRPVPEFFQSLGFDPVMAGRLSLWTAAGICAFAAAVLWRGLPRQAVATATQSSGSVG